MWSRYFYPHLRTEGANKVDKQHSYYLSVDINQPLMIFFLSTQNEADWLELNKDNNLAPTGILNILV